MCGSQVEMSNVLGIGFKQLSIPKSPNLTDEDAHSPKGGCGAIRFGRTQP